MVRRITIEKLPPNQPAPDGYVLIPIIKTAAQLERHLALLAMEDAKDVSPKK